MNLPVRVFQAGPQLGPSLSFRNETRVVDLWRPLRRRMRLALCIAASVFLLVLLGGLSQPRLYTSTVSLMFSPREQAAVGNQTPTVDAPSASALIDSEIEVIRSPDLAERLVDQLNLTRDRAWGGVRAPRRISTQTRERVISNVRRAISVNRQGPTYVANVSVTGHTPDRARQMAATLVDLYFAAQLEQRKQGVSIADRWLQQRLSQLRTEVGAREAAVTQFRAQRGLLSSGGLTLTEQQMTATQTEVLAARADLAEREARQRQVQSVIERGGSAAAASAALQSDTMRELRAREADSERREAELAQRYGEEHPLLQSARAERDSIQSRIQSEVSRISTSLRDEAEVARIRLSSLEGSLAAARNQLTTNDASTVRLRELEREAAAARTVYESYLVRQQEIAQQGRLRPTNVSEVTSASTPLRPSSPNAPLIFVLAIGIGVAAGVGGVYFLALADPTLHDLDDVELEVGQSGLVAIPDLPRSAYEELKGPNRSPAGFVVANPFSAFAEAFRVLHKSIIHALNRQRFVVAVTSALSREGKTSTSVGLARAAAISGERVLLVDCDTRRRTLNEALWLRPVNGLIEVLAGNAFWRDVLYADISGAHILPLAAGEVTPRDVFGPAMQRLLSELSGRYDLIVLDCAPILSVAEARSVVRLADATVVVAHAEKTPKMAVLAAVRQVEQAGGAVLGVALNKTKTQSRGLYSYSDPLYYSDRRYYPETVSPT